MSRPAPLLLDGGIGHLLKAKGVNRLVPGLKYEELFLAGALANALAPDLVAAVHREYVDAGADVLTVNNFACTEWSLARIGQADRQLELVTAAARLARRAADDSAAAGRSVLVAGSLPPLRESYRAAAGLSDFELMQPQYNELAGALKPYCDLLLCETLASVAEGLAAATAASASGLPWWVSWTVEDRQDAPLLRSGEPLAAAVEAVAQLPGLAALLANCSCPQAVAAALPVLAAAAPPGVLVGGYANGFKTTTTEWLAAGSSSRPPLALPEEDYDAEGIILPEAYAHHAARWQQLGAGIVGGCCGVGPAHIAELRKLFPLD